MDQGKYYRVKKQSFKYNIIRHVLKKISSTYHREKLQIWLLSLQILQEKGDLLENLGLESFPASKSSISGALTQNFISLYGNQAMRSS